MTSKWIDFKTVREKLDFVEVLSHYGLEFKGHGKQVKIICPFHDDHKPSYGINLAKQIITALRAVRVVTHSTSSRIGVVKEC